jgi:hypothetical protein
MIEIFDFRVERVKRLGGGGGGGGGYHCIFLKSK